MHLVGSNELNFTECPVLLPRKVSLRDHFFMFNLGFYSTYLELSLGSYQVLPKQLQICISLMHLPHVFCLSLSICIGPQEFLGEIQYMQVRQ